jgi:Protein of unknown function (DUF3035)
MMRRMAVVAGIVLLVGGCGNVRDTLGLGKNVPDEFAVVTRAPLSMPPTYDLRPPLPGAPRPQEAGASDAARLALLGKIPAAGGTTAGATGALQPVAVRPVSGQGEQALLSQAGAVTAAPDVRAQIDRETAQMETVNASLLAQIQQTTVTPDPVVSPGREARRVRTLKQQNAPVSGSGVVLAPVKKPTLWDRILEWF